MGGKFSSNQSLAKCPIHNIPYLGICGEPTCFQNLICPSCSANPCTSLKNHKLISLEDFFEQYFLKVQRLMDLNNIATIIKKYNSISKENLEDKLNIFSATEKEILKQKLEAFQERLKIKIQNFVGKIKKKYYEEYNAFREANDRVEISSFESCETPSLEDTITFIENNKNNIKELKNLISIVKEYSDINKIYSNQKDYESILYSKNLFDQFSILSLNDFETKIRKNLNSSLEKILSELFFHKRSTQVLGGRLFKSDPRKLQFKMNLSKKSQKSYTIDSVFAVYIGNDNETYVAIPVVTFEIEIHLLKNNEIIKLLKGHTAHIFFARYYYCKATSKHLLLSSSNDKTVRVWDLTTYTSMKVFQNCHYGLYLYSAMLVFDYSLGKSYLVTSCPNEYMKLWDLNTGKHLHDIGQKNDYTYYINSWYYQKEIYVINANSSTLKIYNIKGPNLLYKEFKAEKNSWHMSAFIENIQGIPYLFETDGNGYLRVWDVEKGIITKSVSSPGCSFRGLCLWNEQYVICASNDLGFKVIDIEAQKIAASITGHEKVVCSVKKATHSEYGECLITASIDGKVKLWVGGQ